MIGYQLDHFQVTARLGQGGMGEVWRAEDRKLGREVAIKVLPEAFVADPERLARFRREAKVLAALNHPNIAGIYELGEAAEAQPSNEESTAEAIPGPFHFLVMELAEGETLEDRISRGPIKLEETLNAAIRIAEALEAAHELGIIHRDLKPANIKIGADGNLKVLDFGLAKALDPAPSPGDGTGSPAIAASPTLTYQATVAGALMGTAGYMSPEQAKGKPADRRSDIWSFGVVLWEMLTGKRLFSGDSISETLACVLRDDLEPKSLADTLPDPLARLLEHCLQRDPRQRLHDIADARIVLQELSRSPWKDSEVRPELPVAKPRVSRAVWLAGMAGLAFGLVLSRLLPVFGPVERGTNERLYVEVLPPSETRFYMESIDPGPPALSSDGRRIVFSAIGDDGLRGLWMRNLGEPTAVPLPGTRNAQYPFWSPDGRSIGFFANGSLWVTSTSSGSPRTVVPALNGKGGTWGADDTILFSSGPTEPIRRVPSAGGEVFEVTEIDLGVHNSHRHPRFLPGGRNFLFLARAKSGDLHNVMIDSIDGGESRPLATSPAQAEVVGDYLLLMEHGRLVARRLEMESLQLAEEATSLVDDLRLLPGAAFAVFSASNEGSLVYQTGTSSRERILEKRDRQGRLVAAIGTPDDFTGITLSPSGSILAAAISASGGVQDLWFFDLENDLRSRFTMGGGDEATLVFSPSEDSVVFSSNQLAATGFDLYRQALTGAGAAEILVAREGAQMATSWSVDGKIAFTELSPTGTDILFFDLESGDVESFLVTRANESFARFSPDGRWLVFVSDESGRPEAYVTSVANPGRKWQFSEGSGVAAWWRQDGRELMFQRSDGMLVVRPLSVDEGKMSFGSTVDLYRARPPQFSIFDGSAPSPEFDAVYSIAFDEQDDAPLHLVKGLTFDNPS